MRVKMEKIKRWGIRLLSRERRIIKILTTGSKMETWKKRWNWGYRKRKSKKKLIRRDVLLCNE